MSESHPQQNKDPKNDAVIIKPVQIKRSKRVIRTRKVRSTESQPVITPTESSSPQSVIQESKAVRARTSLWKGATNTSQSTIGLLDRISNPIIQYKLFLLFLSIWGAAFILFYLSTSFAVILPDPFNLVVLGFFLASTSLTGIYTFLLGVQHLRGARPSTEDSYY